MQKRKKPAQVVILATTNPDLPRNQEVASYHCDDCDTAFAVNASITPYCVKCGSEQITPVQEKQTANAGYKRTDNLSSIQCECGTYSLVEDKKLSEFAGTLHCVTCGSEMNFSDEVESLGDDDLGYSITDDDLTTSNDDELDDEFGIEANSEEYCENDEFHDDEIAASDESDEEEIYIEDEDAVEASLVDIARGKTSWVRADRKILAFVGELCVATLNKSDTIQSHAAFDKQPFMEAIEAHYNSFGLKKTLKEFSFKPHKIRVEHSSLLEDKIEEVVEQNRADVDTAVASWVSTFKQSLGIAATGLNKNFFQGKKHELKAKFFDELQSAGVRSPATIIDRVFASTSDDHHRTLLTLADEISAKPLEVRNSLAMAIGSANYVMAADEEDEDEVDDSYEEVVEASLEKPMRATQEHRQTKQRLFSIN